MTFQIDRLALKLDANPVWRGFLAFFDEPMNGCELGEKAAHHIHHGITARERSGPVGMILDFGSKDSRNRLQIPRIGEREVLAGNLRRGHTELLHDGMEEAVPVFILLPTE